MRNAAHAVYKRAELFAPTEVKMYRSSVGAHLDTQRYGLLPWVADAPTYEIPRWCTYAMQEVLSRDFDDSSVPVVLVPLWSGTAPHSSGV